MIRDISNAFTMGILIMVFGWVYVTPNIYRAFVPGLFDLEEISPRIYSDAPARALELTRMVRKSEENSGRFFDRTPADPIYIICTKSDCDDRFGRLPYGLTMGFHRVLISSKGVEQSVFNHERIHVDLHALMGFSGLHTQKYPAWFDEGLSEFLSGPKRSFYRAAPEHKRAVIAAHSFREWDALVSDGQYNRHYGAARAVVEDIVRKIGRAKLREIVLNSTSTSDFLDRLPASELRP